MFTFIHAADIHLDSPLRKLEQYEGAPVDAMRGATRRALENLTDLALSEKADFVLIAGDLYDGDWPDYNTGLFFVSQMSKLRQAGVPTVVISGNHDAASKVTKALRLPEGVTMLPADKPGAQIFEDLGVAVHGQGFATPAVKKDLSAGYPLTLPGLFNIGLLHTGFTGRERHEPYAPCTKDGLLSKGYDYWALGHIHKREILHPDPFIGFSGNIQGRHIGETGARGCFVVSVDDKGRAEAEFRPLDVIRWELLEIDASDCADGDEALEKTAEGLESLMTRHEGMPLAVRIDISGESRGHAAMAAGKEAWANEVRSTAVDLSGGRIWIEKILFNTHPPTGRKTGDIAGAAVAEILAAIEEIAADPEQLALAGKSMDGLWKKLPKEVRDAMESLVPEDPEWLAEMVRQTRPMLLDRLLPEKGGK